MVARSIRGRERLRPFFADVSAERGESVMFRGKCRLLPLADVRAMILARVTAQAEERIGL